MGKITTIFMVLVMVVVVVPRVSVRAAEVGMLR